jgi:cytochrome c
MHRASLTVVGLLVVTSALMAGGCQSRGSNASATAPGAAVPKTSPDRFALGIVATSSEIARWDIDVMPDGEGLPEGRGTIDAGRRLYAKRCQHCHGNEGMGVPFDRLVGRLPEDEFRFAEDPGAPRTIGSYWPFATTLFDYTRRAMPSDRPGSLADQEVYDVTAYLLFLNGLLAEDTMLDRSALIDIEMPARDRFFRDDRRGGSEIR